MFSFSEASWEPTVALHLEKGIPKLKEKDWDNIMKGAAEYTNFTENKASKKKGIVATEEELELSWESDSEATADAQKFLG